MSLPRLPLKMEWLCPCRLLKGFRRCWTTWPARRCRRREQNSHWSRLRDFPWVRWRAANWPGHPPPLETPPHPNKCKWSERPSAMRATRPPCPMALQSYRWEKVYLLWRRLSFPLSVFFHPLPRTRRLPIKKNHRSIRQIVVWWYRTCQSYHCVANWSSKDSRPNKTTP